MLTEVLKTVSFMATTDNKVDLKVEVSEQVKQAAQAAAQAAAAAASQPHPGATEECRRKWRNVMDSPISRPGPQAARHAPPPTVASADPPQPIYSAQGSWEREGETYQIKLQDEKGVTDCPGDCG